MRPRRNWIGFTANPESFRSWLLAFSIPPFPNHQPACWPPLLIWEGTGKEKVLTCWCLREESDLYLRNRNPVFYPLDYGGAPRWLRPFSKIYPIPILLLQNREPIDTGMLGTSARTYFSGLASLLFQTTHRPAGLRVVFGLDLITGVHEQKMAGRQIGLPHLQ